MVDVDSFCRFTFLFVCLFLFRDLSSCWYIWKVAKISYGVASNVFRKNRYYIWSGSLIYLVLVKSKQNKKLNSDQGLQAVVSPRQDLLPVSQLVARQTVCTHGFNVSSRRSHSIILGLTKINWLSLRTGNYQVTLWGSGPLRNQVKGGSKAQRTVPAQPYIWGSHHHDV